MLSTLFKSLCILHLLTKPLLVIIEGDVSKKQAKVIPKERPFPRNIDTTETAVFKVISKCGSLRGYGQQMFIQNVFKKCRFRRYVDIFGYWAKNDF